MRRQPPSLRLKQRDAVREMMAALAGTVNPSRIDQSFVAGLEEGGRGALIARTIQQLGNSLGFRTLAEGIETNAQRRSLIEMGCSTGQGFLVSRAVPPDELVRMLDHRFSDQPEAGRH